VGHDLDISSQVIYSWRRRERVDREPRIVGTV